VQLNNLQVRLAPSLKSSHFQPTLNADPFAHPRGEIVSADGAVLAKSTPTNDGYGELRSYPLGPLFADITGYYDAVNAAAPRGIENEYDRYLTYHQASSSTLRQLLTSQNGTDSVVLTTSEALQKVAEQALASGCPGQVGGCQAGGAVVAIDPRNGAVLAMYGNPTYDPNVLSVHDLAKVNKSFQALDHPPRGAGYSPLINYATGQLVAPGSTMKVVTTSAIYDHDTSLLTSKWPSLRETPIKGTDKLLANFNHEICGGDLAMVLATSCDTAFARIGESLGAANLVKEANAFGFNETPPIDLPEGDVAAPQFPSTAELDNDIPFIAYSAIGQGNVKSSALSDALVAAAIGDGGTIMVPHFLAHVVNGTGGLVTSYQPQVWKQATSASTASSVRALMRGVVESGTARGVFRSDLHVAAKTGTAETAAGCSANWMIATAPADPTDTPTVAVAAVIPYQQGLSCGDTGATVAGPIVAKVLSAALALQANQKGTP